MTLPELYEQQQRELEQFKVTRDKALGDLQKAQQATMTAFGGKEKLSEDISKRFDHQIENYHQEWALETGQRHLEITAHHQNQRAAITGQPVNTQTKTRLEMKFDNDHVTDKQIEMQKIIAQQQAIRKRQQGKKRHR